MTNAVDKPTSPLNHENNTSQLLDINKVSEHPGREALKDIAFGSIAGIIGKLIEYPFDTLKVRLQSQPDHVPLRYSGPLDCFRQSLRDEGFRGLYRGISAPLIGAAIETSSLFFSYRIAQELLRSTNLIAEYGTSLPLGALAACGAASGAFTSLLLTPIELIKCQMQVPVSASNLKIQKPFPIITSIYRHHGIWGFWHGQLGTLIRETGGSAAWFGTYEGVSAILRTRNQASQSPLDSSRPELHIWQQMLAGAAAGVSYILGFFPADTIKSRMQTEEISGLANQKKKLTFWKSGVLLWRQQGIKGLYRGCGITVARAAPSSAFIFTVYEGLNSAFR